MDNGGQNMVFSRLNFSELVSDALLPFEPVYFEKGLTLESNVEENLLVMGSQQHLKQVADILLDNASKYASADSTVRVTLRRQGSHCLHSVASAGDAISKEELKNIFKRFYRMDKARSMNHSYGLGLSIADSIVSKHGGKDLGGKRGRGQYLLCPAAHGINIRDGTAVPASFIHRHVTIFKSPFSFRYYNRA